MHIARHLAPAAQCILAAFMAATGCAYAQQDYPSKPVRIIVPSVAGGGTDSSTRIVVAKLGETLGQRVVVDTVPAQDRSSAPRWLHARRRMVTRS